MKKLILLKSIPVFWILMLLLSCDKKTTKEPCSSPAGYFAFSASTTVSGKIDFSPNVYPACTYKWNFGDGTTSTDPHPSHTYTSIGTSYTVTMAFTNSCGASSTWQETVIPTNVTGRIGFYHYAPGFFSNASQYITVTVTGPFSTNVNGTISQSQFMPDFLDAGVLRFTLQPGTYNWTVYKSVVNKTTTGTVTVNAEDKLLHELTFP